MANLANIDLNKLVYYSSDMLATKFEKKISQVYQSFVAFSEYQNFTHPVVVEIAYEQKCGRIFSALIPSYIHLWSWSNGNTCDSMPAVVELG